MDGVYYSLFCSTDLKLFLSRLAEMIMYFLGLFVRGRLYRRFCSLSEVKLTIKNDSTKADHGPSDAVFFRETKAPVLCLPFVLICRTVSSKHDPSECVWLRSSLKVLHRGPERGRVDAWRERAEARYPMREGPASWWRWASC